MKKNIKYLFALITGVGTLSYLGPKASYADLSDKLKDTTTITQQAKEQLLKFRVTFPEEGLPPADMERFLEKHNLKIDGLNAYIQDENKSSWGVHGTRTGEQYKSIED